ncbi:HU family DNA-binding protein [Methylobacterium trifolii]|uniref:HU family DNA-binding protein n=1 Tax=Methylobacterium trifolii TaxID=1003092 RepID=UPI001EDE8449|nr:HU family DNA-binding protein [Methylobacterium trifolii]
MIRSELVARIAAQNPHLTTKACEAVVNTILNCIGAALAAGDRVELRGFCSFSVRRRDARAGRNPRSGVAVQVAARNFVQFNPGKEMRERLHPKGNGTSSKSEARIPPAS